MDGEEGQNCIKDFKIIAVNETLSYEWYSEFDGLLGLSPKQSFFEPESFVEKLA